MSNRFTDPLAKRLYVLTAIVNPARYRSRYALYREFAARVEDAGAILWTIEAAFGRREHEVTQAGHPRHVQLRTQDELWHKENLLNVGLQHLSRQVPDWQYAAWVDADVSFARADWAGETVQQLQHHAAVQMFSHAHDLGPDLIPFQTHVGFAHSYVNHLPGPPAIGDAYYANYCAKWHPGYAWAWRREALEQVGGFIDTAIAGAADAHMAMGLIGKIAASHPRHMPAEYATPLLQWQRRAERYARRNIGCVPGLLLHYWHGKKRDRRYSQRWNILSRNRFDPSTDLKRDAQGLWQLADGGTARHRRLRDELRRYFRARNEDSIDM